MSRLALGTVQFGTTYGVANQRGQVSIEEVQKILIAAKLAGLDTLDTAISYGNSEQRLGQIGVSAWKVVSKLPEIPIGTPDIYSWVEQSVRGSLQRLKVAKLYGLLLHRPERLLASDGDALYKALMAVRDQNLADKIGISVYGCTEIETFYHRFSFDLIQTPFNILDRTLRESGWLARLKTAGVEIHVRSLFLQGLLLMPPSKLPPYFQRWQLLFENWDRWLLDRQITPLQACLAGVLSEPGIDRAIVGVDSLKQFEEIVATETENLPSIPDSLCCNDPDLINPSRWRLS